MALIKEEGEERIPCHPRRIRVINQTSPFNARVCCDDFKVLKVHEVLRVLKVLKLLKVHNVLKVHKRAQSA